MKKFRIVLLVIFVLSLIISVDLLFNLIGNLIPEINDGLGIHSVIFPPQLFWGDSLWSLERFYSTFVTSSLITLVLFALNVVLAIVDISKK